MQIGDYRRSGFVWAGYELRLGKRGRLLASIEPDPEWPGMWRVRLPNGHLTDMVNLARAKDAAIALALADLNRRRVA
jgi:hypothetical protein